MAIEISPNTPPNPVPTVNGISVIWAGDWSSSKIYRRNQGVFHDGSSYRANKTTIEEPYVTAIDWDLIAQGGVASGEIPYYSQTEVDALLSDKVDISNLTSYYTKTEVDNLIPDSPDLTVYYLKSEVDNLLAAKANESTTSAHIASTSNPHSVTATQVGKDTAQWNSDRIKGVIVDDSAKADGKVLKFNSTSNQLEYADDLTGTLGSGEANTASNVGTAGVGVFKQKTGVNLEFKKINAGSTKVTITDDTSNNEVDIDVNEANLTLTNLAGTLSVAKGGTGATSASAALTNLGAASATNLTSHTSNTSNPHSVTAAQVGALATTTRGAANGVASLDASTLVPDTQISSAIARTTALTSHTSNTSNPHSTTAAQVGNTTAQWNANKIQGVDVHTATPTNGQVLTYNSTNTRYEPTTPSSGGGKLIQCIYRGTGNQISTTVGSSWTEVSIGSQLLVTPSNINNKILIKVCLNGLDTNGSFLTIGLSRSSTILTETRITALSATIISNSLVFDYLDSPNTTGQLEYIIVLKGSGTAWINKTVNSYNQGYSSLTIMEVAP